MRIDDPWYDTLASDRDGGRGGPPEPGTDGGPALSADPRAAGRVARLAVHRSTAFREVRRRHRRFVLPAAACLLACQLAHAVAFAAAPGLMARTPGGGPLTVGMAAALAQPAAALVAVRAYLGHARLHRDAAALELRWYTRDQAHQAAGAGAVRAARTATPRGDLRKPAR